MSPQQRHPAVANRENGRVRMRWTKCVHMLVRYVARSPATGQSPATTSKRGTDRVPAIIRKLPSPGSYAHHTTEVVQLIRCSSTTKWLPGARGYDTSVGLAFGRVVRNMSIRLPSAFNTAKKQPDHTEQGTLGKRGGKRCFCTLSARLLSWSTPSHPRSNQILRPSRPSTTRAFCVVKRIASTPCITCCNCYPAK